MTQLPLNKTLTDAYIFALENRQAELSRTSDPARRTTLLDDIGYLYAFQSLEIEMSGAHHGTLADLRMLAKMGDPMTERTTAATFNQILSWAISNRESAIDNAAPAGNVLIRQQLKALQQLQAELFDRPVSTEESPEAQTP